MDYKDKLSNLYLILKENFSEDISYKKEKEYLFLECKGINTPNRKNLTLNLKIKYNDLMLNEMVWSYSAGQVADDHYVLRKDTLESIEQSLKDIVDTEKFNPNYLNSLSKNEKDNDLILQEAKNELYNKVFNEIESLNLYLWKVVFNNSINDYDLIPSDEIINKDELNLTIDVLNNYNAINMIELKNKLNHVQAFHEIERVKDVLKRLL